MPRKHPRYSRYFRKGNLVTSTCDIMGLTEPDKHWTFGVVGKIIDVDKGADCMTVEVQVPLERWGCKTCGAHYHYPGQSPICPKGHKVETQLQRYTFPKNCFQHLRDWRQTSHEIWKGRIQEIHKEQRDLRQQARLNGWPWPKPVKAA